MAKKAAESNKTPPTEDPMIISSVGNLVRSDEDPPVPLFCELLGENVASVIFNEDDVIGLEVFVVVDNLVGLSVLAEFTGFDVGSKPFMVVVGRKVGLELGFDVNLIVGLLEG